MRHSLGGGAGRFRPAVRIELKCTRQCQNSFILRKAPTVRSMATMGGHQALRHGVRSARANAVRRRARGVGTAPHAEDRERWLDVGLRRGRALVRRNRLLVPITAVVAVLSAGVALAAAAAARHGTSGPRLTSATKTAHQGASSGAANTNANAPALTAAQAVAANLN